jgi:hypothetical protein
LVDGAIVILLLSLSLASCPNDYCSFFGCSRIVVLKNVRCSPILERERCLLAIYCCALHDGSLLPLLLLLLIEMNALVLIVGDVVFAHCS